MKKIVKKGDYNRVLLAETAPIDVPVIFSNNWFYEHVSALESDSISDIKKQIIENLFICKNPDKDFVPLKYSILKSKGGVRHIGLLHPGSQTQAVELYRLFADRVINSCSKSDYSIRKPTAISSCYYPKKQKKAILKLINHQHFLVMEHIVG